MRARNTIRTTVAALSSGALLVGVAAQPAAAASRVTSVIGSAYGYHAYNISLFGGVQPNNGPTPTVTLASNASNSPQNASATCGRVAYGPAILFTSDAISIQSAGSLGTSGSATSASSINNINKATNTACNGSTETGSEIFTADRLAGTVTAGITGTSRSTTVTNGTVATHSNSFNCTSLTTPCGGHTHDPFNPDGLVAAPANPPANYKVAGHVHLNDTTTDYFVIVFNEQISNLDGSVTVNPVHEYFGAKLDASGNIVREPPYAQGGSILQGDLILGQVVAGVKVKR